MIETLNSRVRGTYYHIIIISRLHAKNFTHTKVRPFLEHSCASLSSFKIVVISNIIKTNSVDVVLKKTTILKKLRIAQLCSKNERTLGR